MNIEHWLTDRLIPYARNPRKNDHAVDRVAAAIREFGFRVPIIAKSDGTVIDGHLRLKAAHKLGLKSVPVVLGDDLTETQIKAFRISVNRMADLADWDTELLALEIEDLRLEDFNIDLTGFDSSELESIFAGGGTQGGSDGGRESAEGPKEPITRIGDTWILGDCRLSCSNRRDADDGEVTACLKSVDFAVRRWCEFTGHEAIREATGELFSELLRDA